MSDQEKAKGSGVAKSYLGFIDTNVIFKKPVSFLFLVISLAIPVYLLIQVIQQGLFKSGDWKLIISAILVFLFFACAGILGALIWWRRRFILDEGPRVYKNFRRFVQTIGEWTATVIAIDIFFGFLIAGIFLGDGVFAIMGLISIPFLPTGFGVATCLVGPVAGFAVIILTKIFLFLMDPVVWLARQIWALLVRIVLYYYRCVVKVHTVIEQHTPVWFGVIWVISIIVTLCGIVLCFKLFTEPTMEIFLGTVITLALGLGLMAFLVTKRKSYES